MNARNAVQPRRRKLLIIVLFQNLGDAHPYYAQSPAPPLPGILLAALTPDIVDIEVLHEMVRPIDYGTDAEFIALSFMDYLAPHAYSVAARFHAQGKIVVGGGKFASTFPDEVQPHFDAICVGEAQEVWPRMVRDMVGGTLKARYEASPSPSLEQLPPPRYDLVEHVYATPLVTEATRGCPHPCTYCQLNIRRMPHRCRPIADVVRDLSATERLPWYKRKMAMLLDNNLGGDLDYAKRLLYAIADLKLWGLGVQFSIECLRDRSFVDALTAANCRMAFIGMESLEPKSLTAVKKSQNNVEEYREAFERIHRKGILTFTGYMFALEEDTVEYYERLPRLLEDVGTTVILPSIAIPLYGTPLYNQVAAEGRIVDSDLSHYEGDHIVFRHKHMTDGQIHAAYARVTLDFYGWRKIFERWLRFMLALEKTGSIRSHLAKMAVLTFIYLKLSIFQRHHALVKIKGVRLSEAADNLNGGRKQAA
jgi:radical SAM superfamily enzyme YgiQ (UPF0313 family)